MKNIHGIILTGFFVSMLLLAVTGPLYAAGSQPAVGSVDSSFVQTRSLPGFSQPLVSRGIMRFDRQRGFLWEITSPYHYVFRMNGNNATETLPDGTVRHLKPDQTPWLAAVEHIFVSALGGDTSKLQRYFDVKITPQGKSRLVQLTPKPGAIAKAIVSIQITESAPGHPQRLLIKETSGGHMSIRFTPAKHSSATQ